MLPSILPKGESSGRVSLQDRDWISWIYISTILGCSHCFLFDFLLSPLTTYLVFHVYHIPMCLKNIYIYKIKEYM